MKNKADFFKVFILTMVITSCGQDQLREDIAATNVDFRFSRFDQDLFKDRDSFNEADVAALRIKYGEFFDLFCANMIRIQTETDAAMASDLTLFTHDPEVKTVQARINTEFSETRDIEEDMESFLRHLKYYFPEKAIPSVVTYNAAFNYAVITTDSVIGIGLDMFLGPNEEHYAQLGIPRYMFQRFDRQYILPSSIKGWFQSENDPETVKGDLISQMIYHGKMLYYTELMAPDLDDTLNTGYTAAQLQWCQNNESEVWAFFIDKKLLFNTDPSEYVKYINDGPTTSGFPPESPGKIGAWIGWQIIKRYMEEFPEVMLSDLINEQDAMKILEKSKYKPKRST